MLWRDDLLFASPTMQGGRSDLFETNFNVWLLAFDLAIIENEFRLDLSI